MIYHFLKQLLKIALFFFFKKIVVTGKENIPDKGPLIIVANHPNTLMDPLIIMSITKQQLGFVGNASIFINRFVNAVFSYFNVIPIYRKKDILPGEKPDNKKAFIKCHEYLGEGKTLLLFPEGNSYYELKLREIKTGVARIALSFEELNNFEGNLKIVPISLDYSDSIQFRSMISVTVNKPFSLDTYKQTYLNKEFDGILALTEDIRKELAKNIPHTSDKEQEEFLIKVHKFYTAYSEPMADLYLNPKKSLALRSQLSKALNDLNENNSELYQDTENKVYSFFDLLTEEGLSLGFFSDDFLKKNAFFVCLNYFLQFLFLLPLYIYGLLLNYIPYILPSQIFKAMKLDIEYKTSVEMVSGLIIFPLFYILEIWLFRNYISTEFWYVFLFLLTIPVSGYIAMYYYTEIKRFLRVVHFYFFMKPGQKLKLMELRNQILNNLEKTDKKFF